MAGPKRNFKCLIRWSFIERDQSEVIERLQCAKHTSPFGHCRARLGKPILRHCGLWEVAPARAPPPVRETVIV